MPKLQFIACSFPEAANPYYSVRLEVAGAECDLPVNRIECDGKWTRDFTVLNDGRLSPKAMVNADAAVSQMVIRLDWCQGSSHTVKVIFDLPDGTTCEDTVSFTAPMEGGYWNKDWKYYASVVVTENKGVDRVNEPIHQVMAVYSDRIGCPEKEVRVVEIDSVSGAAREIPSQVYNVSEWNGFADLHCQPTCNFDVAFLSSTAAYEKKVYLVFSGNESAEKPCYCTDLKAEGEGMGLTVNNAFYEAILNPDSGSIDEIHLKQGVNQTFCHKLETNGAVHWNPDIYAPPTPWNHISDWNPPEHYTIEKGPVFTMLKRWGTMPMYPDVLCSVTYRFYASYPIIVIQTTMELTKDRDVVALRNGEVVFNRELINEFAWKKPDGSVGTTMLTDVPRHPAMGMRLDVGTEWFVLMNRDKRAGFGVVPVEVSNVRKDEGLERMAPHMYLQVGPWVYVARPLIYTFVGNNPQRVMRAYGNTLNYEKLAWLPFRLDEEIDNSFEAMEAAKIALKSPLATEAVLDTDERVPTYWVPPILLEEFEEL